MSFLMLFAAGASAQTSGALSYQAAVRDADGNVLALEDLVLSFALVRDTVTPESPLPLPTSPV